MMKNNRGSEWKKWDLHLHTASSFDYKYKGEDADELLCAALKSSGISAVAITDHFCIDSKRIQNLRTIEPDIVFFPGVELRTDKGSSNLHVILIFPEDSDLEELSEDFNAIMLRQKAKSADSLEKIYWCFEDIVGFAKDHNALITIHAGRKDNGIDKEITNALPVKEAIKEDIAKDIDFFEIGQKKDVESYEKHVFKCIDRKPLIMCSDNHDPKNYSSKETLWIKGNLTFNGLKQCLYQPKERVYIGVIPPVLDRLEKNKQANIDKVVIKRIDNPINDTANWFNTDLLLNPGMVAIIGNKGTGKSALSDIIANLCNSNTMSKASFLNETRFRKQPKNYSQDYVSTIVWADGETKSRSLADCVNESVLEDAQYLPQKYIEEVCNDIDNIFQEEIDKVIFSYVDRAEKGDAQNLDELVRKKSKTFELKEQAIINDLHDINEKIIKLETKKTETYQKTIRENLKKAQEILQRHDKSKPAEIKKPDEKEANPEYVKKLTQLNEGIEKYKELIESSKHRIADINTFINDANALLAKIELFNSQFHVLGKEFASFAEKYKLRTESCSFTIEMPKEYIDSLVDSCTKEKEQVQNDIYDSEKGFAVQLNKFEEEKVQLIASTTSEEKAYQKYLSDIEEWNRRRTEIVGNKDVENSLEYYSFEAKYLSERLENDYMSLIQKRDELVINLYRLKKEWIGVYQGIYSPIQNEITHLLGNLEERICFQAELFMQNGNMANEFLGYINQRMKGSFGRSKESSYHVVERTIRAIDFEYEDSIVRFVHTLSKAATEDLEQADKKVSDRQGFYDFIYGLNYIGINFKLKMGNRNLNELSPGERGIVLLVFYLALSKESKPIIIDQPEDNLDNQSVFSKLVPCICRAKQKRQVIIVTHNPNIAVACDAEQIIYCTMDKGNYQIKYHAGAIEDPDIRKNVVDILEGTKPAFDLRRRKYVD